MGSVSLEVKNLDMKKFDDRIRKLLKRSHNLEPVWRDLAKYMLNSTNYRFARSKKSPKGIDWAELAQSTIDRKGNDNILTDTGNLRRSVAVETSNRYGFEIKSDVPYASFMQKGVRRGKSRKTGRARNKVPARPFMGFSEENLKRISKAIYDHIAR